MGCMKKSIPSFLFPLAVTLLSMISVGAFAQDDGITIYDVQKFNTEFVERENRTTKSSVVTKDSLQMSDFYQKPKTERASDRKATESATRGEEDDALSLNFLYYIIENYKFSDLMDK